MRRLPPLNALRAFEVAARHESFVAAADEVGVTPAAISRHVKLLEATLGRQLFERRPQSLVLTDFGRSWLPVISEAFDLLEAGTGRLMMTRARTTLALNVQTSFAIGWMLPRFSRFHRERPDLEISLFTHVEAPDLRRDSAIDAAVLHGRGLWPGLDAHFLFSDRLVPVCSPAFLASRPRLTEPAHLLSETLMVAEPSSGDWAAWFAHLGVRGARPGRRMTFANSLLPVQAAMNGLGVALADMALIGPELDSGRLVSPFVLPPFTRGTGWYLVHAPLRRTDPAISALAAWLQREGKMA